MPHLIPDPAQPDAPSEINTSSKGTTMANARAEVTEAWRLERVAARAAGRHNDLRCEWAHLERAHIIGQSTALRHVRTHVAMMLFALRHRDAREFGGQLLRVFAAAPGSWTRRYPTGNTGGANVSAFEAMPIPDDLRAVCHAS